MKQIEVMKIFLTIYRRMDGVRETTDEAIRKCGGRFEEYFVSSYKPALIKTDCI